MYIIAVSCMHDGETVNRREFPRNRTIDFIHTFINIYRKVMNEGGGQR